MVFGSCRLSNVIKLSIVFGLILGNMNSRRENKLDGVGPVDNRPSTDKFHHFVQKTTTRTTKKKVTCDM